MRITDVHKCFEGLIQHWEHDSDECATRMTFTTYVPAEKPRACLIWLSDQQSNNETCLQKTGAARYLSDMRLMMICPDTSPRGLHLPLEHESPGFGTGAGAYVDAVTLGYRSYYRMYSYVTQELYRIVQETFGMEGRISILGHGMGGHGALIMALREARKFRSVSAFVPYCAPSESLWGQKAFLGYLGDSQDLWRMYDASELLKHGYHHPQPVFIDQPSELDRREHAIEDFRELCLKSGQPLLLTERMGYDTSYCYVGTFLKEHILFHAEYLI